MAIRKILTEPDPFLRQKSREDDKVDEEIRKLMDDMLVKIKGIKGDLDNISSEKELLQMSDEDPEEKEDTAQPSHSKKVKGSEGISGWRNSRWTSCKLP